MDIKEAKSMLGTEFTYIYDDGDTIKAYVKAFDPKIGLSCFTLKTKTRDGYKEENSNLEEDGTWCVIGVDLIDGTGPAHTLQSALKWLKEIRDTGKADTREYDSPFGLFIGCAF